MEVQGDDISQPVNNRSTTGQFKQGHSGNLNGRPEGSKNARTLEWEEFGRAIIEGNIPWVIDRLTTLKVNDPDKALSVLMEFMEYFKPKLSRQELKAPKGSEVTYTVKFK